MRFNDACINDARINDAYTNDVCINDTCINDAPVNDARGNTYEACIYDACMCDACQKMNEFRRHFGLPRLLVSSLNYSGVKLKLCKGSLVITNFTATKV